MSSDANFCDSTSYAAVIGAVMARFGRLDVIVNNAGSLEGSPVNGFDMDGFG
jgi:NAD(P)-dependent dehydrogenase (short-subunit alcohol dehydrogenase family)